MMWCNRSGLTRARTWQSWAATCSTKSASSVCRKALEACLYDRAAPSDFHSRHEHIIPCNGQWNNHAALWATEGRQSWG